MADRNLIAGAALSADRFNTGLAATVDKSIARATGNITKMLEAQEEYRNRVDNIALDIINQFPEDIEFNKVDNLHVDKLQGWATNKKQQFFEKAKALAQTRPGSEEFFTIQSELNNIKKAYINVNNNLINLQAKRNEWTKNYGNISDGLDVEKKEAFNKLLLPNANYQLEIDDTGSSTYTVQLDSGKSIKLTGEDLNWAEKDVEFYNQANQLGNAFVSAGSKGVLIKQGDYNYDNTVGQLNVLLSKDTKNRMLSIANDDIFDGYKLNLSDQEKAQIINDPINSKNIVVNKLLEHYQRINKDAYDNYSIVNNNNNNNINDFSGFTPGKQQDIKLFTPTAARAFSFATNALTNEARVRELRKLDFDNKKDYMSKNEFFNLFKNSEDAPQLVGMTSKQFNRLSEDAKLTEFNKIYKGDLFEDQKEIPLDNQKDLFTLYLNAAGLDQDLIEYFSSVYAGELDASNDSLDPLVDPKEKVKLEIKDTMRFLKTGQEPVPIDEIELTGSESL